MKDEFYVWLDSCPVRCHIDKVEKEGITYFFEIPDDEEEDCDEPKEDMVGFEGTWEALDKLTNIKHLPDKEEK